MRAGVLVRALKLRPTLSRHGASFGLGIYDWEGKIGIVVGISSHTDALGENLVEVHIQETGRLCLFSSGSLERV